LRPTPTGRLLLVGEVVGYVAIAAAYIWAVMPLGKQALGLSVLFYLFAAAFPICANLIHGDRPADSGLRLDNIRASTRQVAAATAVMAGAIVAAGLAAGGFHWVSWTRLCELAGAYTAWGLAQQYLLQAFAFRRFRQAGLGALPAAGLAAMLFGLLHAPNWPLVALATGAGVIWCLLFNRRPNIITLALAHAILAVLLYHAWPVCWHQNLLIGPTYLRKYVSSIGIDLLPAAISAG